MNLWTSSTDGIESLKLTISRLWKNILKSWQRNSFHHIRMWCLVMSFNLTWFWLPLRRRYNICRWLLSTNLENQLISFDHLLACWRFDYHWVCCVSKDHLFSEPFPIFSLLCKRCPQLLVSDTNKHVLSQPVEADTRVEHSLASAGRLANDKWLIGTDWMGSFPIFSILYSVS